MRLERCESLRKFTTIGDGMRQKFLKKVIDGDGGGKRKSGNRESGNGMEG
jgi:hypothetical protein